MRAAHMAAKLPGFFGAEFAFAEKLKAEAGAALLLIADSMIEVTVASEPNVKAHSTLMHLKHQSEKPTKNGDGAQARSGIKRMRSLPMEETKGRRVAARQGLPTPGRF